MEKGVCVCHMGSTFILHSRITFTNYLFSLKNGRKKLKIEEKMLYNYIQTGIYIYTCIINHFLYLISTKFYTFHIAIL
jgi:hypothetical protein